MSPYTIGWILGIEWEPELVDRTNREQANVSQYNGQYVYTEGASPFEVWLAGVSDFAIAYETENYRMQRPVAFTNWPTTDPLRHPNEPYQKEDWVKVNVEHIKAKNSFRAGFFAAYHVYPYYPDFMFYDEKYRSFRDEDGRPNTYRAYLRDLVNAHTLPVLIAEFGVPSSRGIAHINPLTNFNQGYLNEQMQGEMLASMLQDIYREGCAGGLVFSWHDEWFKRTWNTQDLDLAWRRPYWHNVQTNEQCFGLLAFDPGEEKRVVYVDGDPSEWKDEWLVTGGGSEAQLYAQADEECVYFLIRHPDLDPQKHTLVLAIDVLPEQGNTRWMDRDLDLERACEFLVVIDGEDNSRVLVDAYYNPFYYLYGK
ncbi:MAG: family 2 glycosyl transferase, partial [Synergistales bacterium]|nr:family 2 glycosyl transferase [Synergistales bacterium]